jgi:predicted AlkP superfamily pyrophosphatase or phosphodiesterase
VQLTGAYPATKGIVGNDWFDRFTGKSAYCVADPDVQVIGTASSKPMSPKNLLV